MRSAAIQYLFSLAGGVEIVVPRTDRNLVGSLRTRVVTAEEAGHKL